MRSDCSRSQRSASSHWRRPARLSWSQRVSKACKLMPRRLRSRLKFTEGYPYFLQEVGSAAWEIGTDDQVTFADMGAALPLVERKLDESFFLVRVERCTDLELHYMRAMVELGSGPQKSGEIATTLGYTGSEELGPTRASLISKGLIYTPSHGVAEFTVPQFDKFLASVCRSKSALLAAAAVDGPPLTKGRRPRGSSARGAGHGPMPRSLSLSSLLGGLASRREVC